MDDKPKDRPSRAAERAAINLINTSKKRSASSHEYSGRAKKAYKTTPSAPSAPSALSAPSARVDKGAEDVSTPFHKTPATNRQASHTSLIEHETTYASDMQKQIVAEAREVSRKNVPWDEFCSIYLCGFSVKAQPKLTVKSVQNIGADTWKERLFWDRLRQSLSEEVRYSGCAFIRLSVLY
jgi:hypothetical protein